MRLNDSSLVAPAPGATLPRQALLFIALAVLAPFALYFTTAQSIVTIWNTSDTFAHGYIIFPISAWLIWRRRANFALFPPTPWWPALVPLTALGAGWTLASLGEVSVVMQYAFVAMIPVVALAMLGVRLAASLAFPLLFLLFAVPFGEIFIPPLIEFTADFTIWAVQLTGIPVLRNGTRFELPSGNWSVVEACSGVRYLISSVTIGCLYAYLTYRSTTRRVVFVLLSIVAPILANGLRAFMIVMIGHHSGMTMATGVDHLIYGWVFFGIVMFIMFWIGSYWREDTDAAPVLPAGSVPAAPVRVAALRNMALAVLACCAIWPAFVAYNNAATRNPQPVTLPPVAVSWPTAPAFSVWVPNYMPADASYNGVFRQGEGKPVSLTVIYYRNQTRGKTLISTGNRLVHIDDPFHEGATAMRSESFAGRSLALRETVLDSATGKQLVWQWVRVDGQDTVANHKGKLLQARAKLLFRGDDGAAILVSAPFSEHPDEARTALRAFLGAHLGAIDHALETARGGQ